MEAGKVRRITLAVLKWAGISLLVLLLLVVVGSVTLPRLTRARTDRWGATTEEAGRLLSGDDLVREPVQNSTRATTIKAPAGLVWALVAQMGYKRAGWYGWDWFYKLTGSARFVDGHSSRRLVPELQNLAVGDRIYINKSVAYEVAGIDPSHILLLWSGYDKAGKPVPYVRRDEATVRMTWVWIAEPIDANTTRLILRMRSQGSQGRFVDWLFDNPLDLGGAIMSHKTLVGIRRTAERLAAE